MVRALPASHAGGDGVKYAPPNNDMPRPTYIRSNKRQALPDHRIKPSSFSVSSQRSSPFRRPETPGSPSPLRATTPTSSPFKASQPTPKFSSSTSSSTSSAATASDNLTPRAAQQQQQQPQRQAADDMFGSPRAQRPPLVSTASHASAVAQGNALAQLQPAQVRQMREGFQILDRDSDGSVNREDVTDMLNQLGLPSNATEVARFFPPSAPQTITLATFLNTIATSLTSLSPSTELLSAFSAFDDDDSGQIDLAELRDALLHTAPEPGESALSAAEIDQVMAGFSGKRAFGGKVKTGNASGFAKRGEVFRYQDFVASTAGSGSGSTPAGEEEEEQEE
ncbi:unnamed protein product [Discula destructiva]